MVTKKIVPSRESVKILLVEDDERQIKWAEQCLSQHKLIVLRGYDPERIAAETVDLVLTDLELPFINNGVAEDLSPDWGMRVLQDGIEQLVEWNLRGLALLSNFDRHVSRDTEGKFARLSQYLKMFKMFGKLFLGTSEICWPKDCSFNLIIEFDRSVAEYTHYVDSEGNIKVGATDIPEQRRWNSFSYIKEQGWTPLKSYKQVVDALLTNRD